MDSEIWFYDPKEKPWGVFSNFAVKKFKIDDTLYFTSEAYFQSQKFAGPDASQIDLEYAKLVAEQKTGGKPAVLARQVKPRQNYPWAKDLWVIIQDYLEKGVKMRDDWFAVKDNIMRRAVYQKFLQNPDSANILKGTRDKPIFEHTHRDHYWADGHPYNDPTVHGDGQNMLGRILEETRYLLGGCITRDINTSIGVWLIPGMFLVSDESSKTLIENGIRYIIDENQKLGCRVEKSTLFANWGDNLSISKLKEVAKTIATSIGRHFPVAISESKAHEVVRYVFEEIYGTNYWFCLQHATWDFFEDDKDDKDDEEEDDEEEIEHTQDLLVLQGMTFKAASKIVKQTHPKINIDKTRGYYNTEEYRHNTIRLRVDKNDIVISASYN